IASSSALPRAGDQPPAPTRRKPPKTRRSAEDEAIMRDLELFMLMEMLKDYDLFYEDPQEGNGKR
ncbi:MAG: hypothetical protein OXT09_04675, partial [Myxococcales bacterium]|nr:hypothetical protein [Myxococcales bacterium]